MGVILNFLTLLWIRRSVIIHRAEGILSETTCSPFRTRRVHYRREGVRCVQLTYWIDDQTTWKVGIDLGGGHRIQLGSTPREIDARHLSGRVSQVLGVPVRDQAAEVTASAS